MGTNVSCCSRALDKGELANLESQMETEQLMGLMMKASESEISKSSSNRTAGGGRRSCCCCCCCFCLLCLPALLYLAIVGGLGFLGNKSLASLSFSSGHQVYSETGKVVTPNDVSDYEWWPACEGLPNRYTNCDAECCKCHMVDAFRAYNAQCKYSAVAFPSRRGNASQEIVNLTGWWLPADTPLNGRPAIVIQHGMGGSINDMRVQLTAFLLRTAGFSVLLPNLRDHGSAGNSSHKKQSWGWDYPLDTLGAWDYVVQDPQGKLGGRREKKHVGLMGYSLGGFIAATAFGLEPKAPALFLDGAISDPKDLMTVEVERYLGYLGPLKVIAPAFVEPAWLLVGFLSGLDLRHALPEDTLAEGPSQRRPVMVMHAVNDTSAPRFMAEHYIDVLAHPEGRYNVSARFDLGGTCKEHDHNMLQWLHPRKYRQVLCDFFSRALIGEACSAIDLGFLS